VGPTHSGLCIFFVGRVVIDSEEQTLQKFQSETNTQVSRTPSLAAATATCSLCRVFWSLTKEPLGLLV